MHINPFFKHLSDDEKNLFKNYFPKKLDRLEKLLTEYDEDEIKLNVTCEKFATKAAYRVDMFMELPKASKEPLHVTEDSHDMHKAIDLCIDKLVKQIKKALEKLHHEHQRAA